MQQAVILGATRCAVGRGKKGVLANTRPDDLAAFTINALLEKTKVSPKEVEDLRMGCAMPEAEQGMNIARIALFGTKLPLETSAVTVNRFCSSGLEAIAQAAYQIAYGDVDLVIAGGVESMTRVPMGGYTPRPNPKFMNEFPEVYIPMGITAEIVAEKFNITRQEQDEYAYHSQKKAAQATKEGKFKDEIFPLELEINGKKFIHDKDETIREDTTLEGLAALKPAFKTDGTVTAGNSSPLTDGASFVLIASEKKAKELGIKPLAKFVSAATVGLAPDIMGLGPAYAVPKALQKANLKLSDIDLFEFNEAFAAQAVAVLKELKLLNSMDKINVNGGAIALGHALGSSGARLTTTLVYEMQKRNSKYGVVSMCIGGGQGMAAVFEKV